MREAGKTSELATEEMTGRRASEKPRLGSNNSAVFMLPRIELTTPPATRTPPLGSSVAVWTERGEVMLLGERAANVPVVGSNNSAVSVATPPTAGESPPVIRTLPLGRSVAV